MKVPREKEVTAAVGTGGEFYLENLKPGRTTVQVDWRGKTGLCDLAVPKSEELQVELGTVTCAIK